jgi:ABC-type dipeptide/oligopeptide/nickel transport system permease subunit
MSTGASQLEPVETDAASDVGSEASASTAVKARSYWEQVWIRFRRDRLALASIFFIVFLVLAAFPGAYIAQKLLGHGPNQLFFDGVDEKLVPVGPWTYVTDPQTGEKTLLILGADGSLGRDEFLRLLYGARASLEVALLSTVGVVSIGVTLGATAGYYRGAADTVISRVIDVTMAFPSTLFIIALAGTAGDRLNDITLGFLAPGVVTLVIVFTVFGWFFIARIVRAQVLSLREKEFIEAARMIGASDARIIRSHLLPHLVAPIIVYSTLIVAGYVIGEAGLSFLNLGIKLPTASWGNLLATAPEYYTSQPSLMLWPGLAVLLTTLAFNLLGDGLRDAFDPRSAN